MLKSLLGKGFYDFTFIMNVYQKSSTRAIIASIFLQLATHCICLKHSNQTDEDLYLSYKRVIEMVKMTTKSEKEKEASRMFINSVMPSVLAERVIR